MPPRGGPPLPVSPAPPRTRTSSQSSRRSPPTVRTSRASDAGRSTDAAPLSPRLAAARASLRRLCAASLARASRHGIAWRTTSPRAGRRALKPPTAPRRRARAARRRRRRRSPPRPAAARPCHVADPGPVHRGSRPAASPRQQDRRRRARPHLQRRRRRARQSCAQRRMPSSAAPQRLVRRAARREARREAADLQTARRRVAVSRAPAWMLRSATTEAYSPAPACFSVLAPRASTARPRPPPRGRHAAAPADDELRRRRRAAGPRVGADGVAGEHPRRVSRIPLLSVGSHWAAGGGMAGARRAGRSACTHAVSFPCSACLFWSLQRLIHSFLQRHGR